MNMKKTFGVALSIGALIVIFMLMADSSKLRQQKAASDRLIDSLKRQLVLYQDSVETVLNRGDRCDSFATCPLSYQYNQQSKGLKRVAIRNWTAYHQYLYEMQLTDSVYHSKLRVSGYDTWLNLWGKEYEKEAETKLTMFAKLVSGRPELQKMQLAVFASYVLDDAEMTSGVENQLQDFAQSPEVSTIQMFESQTAQYYNKKMEEASKEATETCSKKEQELWEYFLKVNR